MEEGSVVSLPRPGTSVADDPLLAVLREGARRMLTQAIEAEVEAFLAAHRSLVDERGRRAWSATGMRRSGASRPGSDRSRCAGRGSATAATAARPRSVSARPSCRPTCGGPGTSRSCCPGSTSRASRPGSSRRRWRPCSAPRRPVCPRRPCAASRRLGRGSTRAGSGAICRPGATSISGPTASTSPRGSTTSGSACWSCSGPTRAAARSCWR